MSYPPEKILPIDKISAINFATITNISTFTQRIIISFAWNH